MKMVSEKTPLLLKSSKGDVVVKIPGEFDENNNRLSITTSLTYEELLPYIIDPYWIRIRRIVFSLTCTALAVIFLAACISSFEASSVCHNTLLTTTLTDKENMINQTTEEIPKVIGGPILSITEKLGLVGG